MNLLALMENVVLQAQWLLAAPHVMETVAVIGGGLLAAVVWPRGCCKQDDLFSRKAV